uniref:Uncharacterized protein n=1 Tax=Rhizophora mucronata TaxID=61149 RepID=A0A2P2JJB8_RHIMU
MACKQVKLPWVEMHDHNSIPKGLIWTSMHDSNKISY